MEENVMKKYYENTKCGNCLSKKIHYIEYIESENIYSLKYTCICSFSSIICSICCFKFSIENSINYNFSFDRHLKLVHSRENNFQCTYCNFVAKNIYSLLFHCERHFLYNSLNIEEILVVNDSNENNSFFLDIDQETTFDMVTKFEFEKKIENFCKNSGYLQKLETSIIYFNLLKEQIY